MESTRPEERRPAPADEQTSPAVELPQPRCPFCHEDVKPGTAQLACNRCRAWHHQECWTEGGGRCAACSAGETGDPKLGVAYGQLGGALEAVLAVIGAGAFG